MDNIYQIEKPFVWFEMFNTKSNHAHNKIHLVRCKESSRNVFFVLSVLEQNNDNRYIEVSINDK